LNLCVSFDAVRSPEVVSRDEVIVGVEIGVEIEGMVMVVVGEVVVVVVVVKDLVEL